MSGRSHTTVNSTTHLGTTSTPCDLMVSYDSRRCSFATFCSSSTAIFPLQNDSRAFLTSRLGPMRG